jgi:Ribonucleotide reductase, small chain
VSGGAGSPPLLTEVQVRASVRGVTATQGRAPGTSLAAAKISYEDLYARWEHGNWSATDLDFTEDARQWREVLTPFEREAALWNYALFFWGEDAVADNLSPFIDAAPREEQKYFLATQQVDEARHAVFFGRFMREVAGLGSCARGGPGEAARGGRDGGGQAELLEAIRPRLTWGFARSSTGSTRWPTSCAETARVPSSRRPSRSTTW